MYLGKPLFVQVMDFLPWKTFHRIVDRYGGDHRTRSLSCAEQFRIMAFAQLTYRESLRDIEVCLAAQAGKLYHMGIGAKALLMGVLPQWLIIATGSILILFSVFCFGAGVWRHLYAGPPPPVPDAPRMHPALLLYVNGILALVSIAALIGIWFG